MLLTLSSSVAFGCSDDGSAGDAQSGSESDTDPADGSETAGESVGDGDGDAGDGDGDAGDGDGDSPLECEGAGTYRELVVCSAEAFLATLSDDEKAVVLLDWTDSVAKTRWSNLPGVNRNGLKLGDLDDESRAAALLVAETALSEQGYEDYEGLLAADDYLGEQGGGGGGGPGGMGGYSSDNSIIAFIGAPSVSDDWMLQLGNHHMAFNLTFTDDGTSPTPNHEGCEPKVEFSVNGESYAPLTDEGDAFFGIFDALDGNQLDAAYLSGQSFGDVLLGPVEYQSGSYDAVSFPTGANRGGLLVSMLDADQQLLVEAIIEAWVRDYPAEVSDALVAEYTTDAAFADTYVAWAGNGSGPDPDVAGTYLRIDGPAVWIELACQNGVIIQGQTHFHTIFRDKTRDYGGSL